MKLKNYMAMMSVVLFALACSDDDKEVKPEYARQIAGTYNGSMDIGMATTSASIEGATIVLARVAEDSVDVTLSSFAYGGMTLPDIKAGAKVAMKGDTYTLKGEVDVSGVTGDFTGTTDGKALNMAINITPAGMPMPIAISFGGSQSQSSMTLDVSDYANWTYINLKTGETQTHRDFSAWNYLTDGNVVETTEAQGSEADITIDWHIAIHRDNIRTNGGSAFATTSTVLSDVTALPSGEYKEDETVENTLMTDRSGMMSSPAKIGYAATSTINTVLSAWVNKVATGTMPPYIYEPTHLVYVVKNTDGSYAKLKFTDFYNATGTTGHVTFSYEYVAK